MYVIIFLILGSFYTDGPSMSFHSFCPWTNQEITRQRHPIHSEHCSGELRFLPPQSHNLS